MVSTRKPTPDGSLVRLLVCVAAAVFAGGCLGRDGVVWSPDGTRAAFSASDSEESAVGRVYDATGKAVADLGPAAAVFGWSADGADLYFVRVDPAAAEPKLDRRWVGPAATTTSPATRPAATGPTAVGYTLCRWHDGKADPIAPLGRRQPTGIACAPDRQWVIVTGLAVTVGPTVGHHDEQLDIDALAVETTSGRTFVLADHAGTHVCFTGPHRVVFIATAGDDVVAGGAGPLVEVTLDAAADPLPRTTISGERCVGLESLAATADGSLLFGCETTGEHVARFKSADEIASVLCRWDRKSGRTSMLCDRFDYSFALSPDGRRIVYYQRDSIGHGEYAYSLLVLSDADGGNRHVLRPAADAEAVRLPPAWHGNDRLTLSADADDPAAGVRADDVVDYRITAAGTLAVDRVLSRDWPAADRPKRWDRNLKVNSP